MPCSVWASTALINYMSSGTVDIAFRSCDTIYTCSLCCISLSTCPFSRP